MNFFITGGAGFIGSYLADELISRGQVTVYDNLSSGKEEFIAECMVKDGFQFIKADLLDFDKLKQVIQGHDVVFHMAANPDVREGIKETDLDLKQGTIATYNVLEAMRLNGIKKVVFASSSTVYGETPVEPIPEDYGPLQPISLYGASKLASEALITAYSHLYDMQTWIFRFANVIGFRATHGILFDFLAKLQKNRTELEVLGNGKQAKPYIHVTDCVAGIIYGFEHAGRLINVFNLGTETVTTVDTIAEELLKAMGLANTRVKYTGGERGWPGDVPKMIFDTSRMEKLGWRARYSSGEAVNKAIAEIIGKAAGLGK